MFVVYVSAHNWHLVALPIAQDIIPLGELNYLQNYPYNHNANIRYIVQETKHEKEKKKTFSLGLKEQTTKITCTIVDKFYYICFSYIQFTASLVNSDICLLLKMLMMMMIFRMVPMIISVIISKSLISYISLKESLWQVVVIFVYSWQQAQRSCRLDSSSQFPLVARRQSSHVSWHDLATWCDKLGQYFGHQIQVSRVNFCLSKDIRSETRSRLSFLNLHSVSVHTVIKGTIDFTNIKAFSETGWDVYWWFFRYVLCWFGCSIKWTAPAKFRFFIYNAIDDIVRFSCLSCFFFEPSQFLLVVDSLVWSIFVGKWSSI